MSASCCGHAPHSDPPRSAEDAATYRRVLWCALVVNVAMFAVEIVSGLQAGSVSLLADAVDFFGDAANYGVSLLVLGMSVAWRARASLLKAASMAAFGVGVLALTIANAISGTVPEAPVMGIVGFLALTANLGVALMLWRFRNGDSNMRSVWICTRNDALGNLAVMGAALGVFGTGSGWPDFVVASVMAFLALQGAWMVSRQAFAELAPRPTLAAAE